jgi:uncharacterized cupredoxin-like copper-binding protein
MRKLFVLLVSIAALGGLASCSSSDSRPDMKATLGEWLLKLDPTNAKAGKVDVEVKNEGGTTHEFVIVRAPSIESIPLKADGAANEAKIAEADKMGEIEDIAPGKTVSKTFDLPSGSYVAFCNIVQEDTTPHVVHYAKGMYAPFTVER